MKDRPQWLPAGEPRDASPPESTEGVRPPHEDPPRSHERNATTGQRPSWTGARARSVPPGPPGPQQRETAPLNLPAFDTEDEEGDGERGAEVPNAQVPGAQLQPKELFEGRFYVVSLLALGGMAEVYEAFDMVADRVCALKILRLSHSRSEKIRLGMIGEARALIEMKHPYIVEAWEAGVTAQGLIYIAMELLTGMTLHDRIHGAPEQPRPGLVPLRLALTWIAELSSAAGALHKAGIIHRDIKPENVFVTLDGHIRVLDLGAAKFRRYGLQTTGAHRTIGTPPYMSPEHLRGDRTIDGRSDVYSLGHVFYEMIAQEHAFYSAAGEYSAENYRLWQEQRRPRPLEEKRPGLPRLVGELVLKALEKRREDRWQSCREIEYAAMGLLDALASDGTLDALDEREGVGIAEGRDGGGEAGWVAMSTTAEAVAGATEGPAVVRVAGAAPSGGAAGSAGAAGSGGAAAKSGGAVEGTRAAGGGGMPESAVVRRTKGGTVILPRMDWPAEGEANSPRTTSSGTEIVETGEPARPVLPFVGEAAEGGERAAGSDEARARRADAGMSAPIGSGPLDPRRKAVEELRQRVRARAAESEGATATAPLPDAKGGSLEVVTTETASTPEKNAGKDAAEKGAKGKDARGVPPLSARRPVRRLAPALMLVAGFVALVSGGAMLYLARHAPASGSGAAASGVTVPGTATTTTVTVEPVATATATATTTATATATATTTATATATGTATATAAATATATTTAVPTVMTGRPVTKWKAPAPKVAPTAAPSAEPTAKPRRPRLPTNPRPKSDRVEDGASTSPH